MREHEEGDIYVDFYRGGKERRRQKAIYKEQQNSNGETTKGKCQKRY